MKKISILKTCRRKKDNNKKNAYQIWYKKTHKGWNCKINLKNDQSNSIEREGEKKTWRLIFNKLNVEWWNGNNSN